MDNTYTYALLISHDSYDPSTNKSNITVKAYILCSDGPTSGASDSKRIFYDVYCTASCIINGNSIGSSGWYACYYNTSLDNLPSSPLWTKTISILHSDTSKKLTLNVSGAFTHKYSEIWMPPSGMSITPSSIELTNPVTYKISYNKNGGNATLSEQIKVANTPITLATAISKNNDTETVTTSFNKNGGDRVSPVSRNSTITIGYSFNGWQSSSDGKTYEAGAVYTLNKSTTMTAVWRESSHTGSEVALPGTSSANNGDKIERTGYTFIGWYKDGVKYETYSPTSSTTLIAQWMANEYTVTFNANGGDIEGDINSIEVTYDSTYESLPSAIRKGYKFVGWYTPEAPDTMISKDTKVSTTSDQTLYARWTAETYTINLNPTNGHFSDNTETIKSYEIKYDESSKYLESDHTPVRIGYNFLGWTTNSDGSDDGNNWLGKLMSSWEWTKDDEVGIQDGNIVYLYPIWESAEVYVKYKIYQGTTDEFGRLFNGKDDKLSINNFKLKSVSEAFQDDSDKIKNYHKVFGWYTLEGDKITDFEMLLDNITDINDEDNIGICDVYAKIGPRYKLLYIDSNGYIGRLNLAIDSDNENEMVYPYIEMKDEEN